jgi:hypothetical protein
VGAPSLVAVPGRECRLSSSHPGPDAELAETGVAGRQERSIAWADGSICSAQHVVAPSVPADS